MIRTLLTTLLLLGLVAEGMAQQTDESVVVSSPSDEDFYAAGRRVDVRARLGGDAVVAGQTVDFSAPVNEDIIAAGENVIIRAPVGDDVRAAGRSVRLESNVGGHLLAAGAEVELARGSRVASFAWLAGNTIMVAGNIAGSLRAAGETVRIAGQINGDAQISARHLELLPGARIAGDLRWEGGQPEVSRDATVGGTVTGRPRAQREEEHVGAWIGGLFVLAFAVTGLVLYLMFPRAAQAVAETVRARPALSIVLGFAWLFLTPFLIVLLFVTGVGWLLGALLLALYFVAFPLGGLLGAYALTDTALRWLRRPNAGRALRAVALLVVVVLVGLLQWVPVVGWLTAFVLLLAGIGAMLTRGQRAAGTTPAAS